MTAKPQASGGRQPRPKKPQQAAAAPADSHAKMMKAIGMGGYNQKMPKPRRGHR